MATNTVTQPVGFPQRKQIVRQGFVVAVLLVIGVGLGMAVDDVRGISAETLPMEGSAESPAAKTVAEHGEFTPLAYRDPLVFQKRFVGSDANLDPDVVGP
jgi:hypothetical protein